MKILMNVFSTRLAIDAKAFLVVVFCLLISLPVFAQQKSSEKYMKAKEEIQLTFGVFPSFFEAFPRHALPGAWEAFKQLKGPESNIPHKYQELIQLAVAAQIPCEYCVYFHTAMAENFGAGKEEIKEAIALGAETRHWSMIVQGSQTDFESFKMEFDKMLNFMSMNTDK